LPITATKKMKTYRYC